MTDLNFKDINSFYKAIEKEVIEMGQKIGAQECKEILSEEIEKAYNEYSPRIYVRRYNRNGGFGDPKMLKDVATKTRNGIKIVVTNEARAVGEDKGDRLDEIIEEGRYQYEPSPSARPVFARANRTLENKLESIENKLVKELEKKGY